MNARRRDGVRLHLADKFHSLGSDQLREMEAWLKQKPVPHERAVPDPAFQTKALSDIKSALKTNDRATVVIHNAFIGEYRIAAHEQRALSRSPHDVVVE